MSDSYYDPEHEVYILNNDPGTGFYLEHDGSEIPVYWNDRKNRFSRNQTSAKCYHCGRTGHLRKDCRRRSRSYSAGGREGKCKGRGKGRKGKGRRKGRSRGSSSRSTRKHGSEVYRRRSYDSRRSDRDRSRRSSDSSRMGSM